MCLLAGKSAKSAIQNVENCQPKLLTNRPRCWRRIHPKLLTIGYCPGVSFVCWNYEDRWWKFTCGKLPAPTFGLSDCGWSGYANNYDQNLKFECPNDGVITGLVFCCFLEFCFSECSRNSTEIAKCHFYFQCSMLWFDPFSIFFSPISLSFSGIWSRHDNHREDRIFRFNCCQLYRPGIIINICCAVIVFQTTTVFQTSITNAFSPL